MTSFDDVMTQKPFFDAKFYFFKSPSNFTIVFGYEYIRPRSSYIGSLRSRSKVKVNFRSISVYDETTIFGVAFIGLTSNSVDM